MSTNRHHYYSSVGKQPIQHTYIMQGVTLFIVVLGTAAVFMSAHGVYQPDNDSSELSITTSQKFQ